MFPLFLPVGAPPPARFYWPYSYRAGDDSPAEGMRLMREYAGEHMSLLIEFVEQGPQCGAEIRITIND
jgi:hypothetical protein